MSPMLIPTLDDAIISYESSGGSLSTPSLFGIDPLSGHQELLLQRESWMQAHYPSLEDIFWSCCQWIKCTVCSITTIYDRPHKSFKGAGT